MLIIIALLVLNKKSSMPAGSNFFKSSILGVMNIKAYDILKTSNVFTITINFVLFYNIEIIFM